MTNEKVLKLGTRKSLLAITQSTWVAKELEKRNPGYKIELVGIETKGDLILDIPLSKVEGKEFFVKELDDALLRGDVDLTVHSMKDLSLDRPEGITLGCVPPRENPRDIIFFHSRVLDLLKTGKRSIIIGTSAPRRLENLPEFLKKALPHAENSKLEFKEIRGNVNTRLSRIYEKEDSPKFVDAVVLALAGINRLMANEEAKAQMIPLLKDAIPMVIPLNYSPTAPAQGVLAVECRTSDDRVLSVLKTLHSTEATNQSAKERKILKEWGGGCHQSLGATAITHKNLGDVLFVKGKKSTGEKEWFHEWNTPPSIENSLAHSFSSALIRAEGKEKNLNGTEKSLIANSQHIVVAHSKALTTEVATILKKHPTTQNLWASGVASWFRLAKEGFWVCGSSEGLGVESLFETIQGPLFQKGAITYLTHSEAPAVESPEITTISSYEASTEIEVKTLEKLSKSQFFFWTSASHYDALFSYLPKGKTLYHSCGAGRTFDELKKRGLTPEIFPSEEEWMSWLR